MQSGSSHRAIVQDLKSPCRRGFYKRSHTEWKTAAHQRFRHRVKQEMHLIATARLDADDFDGSPVEGLDAWDIY